VKKENCGARVIIGAQWGDEGKGLISAYISLRDKSKLVCGAGIGPNAEHGIFLNEQGPYIKVNQLPLGWIFNPESQIRIGSGVSVNPDLFLEEVERFNLFDRVKIDYRCNIITRQNIENEKNNKGLQALGSTFSGSGFSRAEYVLRRGPRATDIPKLKPFLMDTAVEINQTAIDDVITVESTQGTMLSLAISPEPKNTTSGNVTTPAAIDRVLLGPKKISQTIMVVKTMPTREGAGTLGSRELSDKEMIDKDLVERSSIGGAIRRKAEEIDWEMLSYACMVNDPDQIALTFCEHYDPQIRNIQNESQIPDKTWRLIEKVESVTGQKVTILNTGKKFSSIIDRTGKTVDWKEIENNLAKYKKIN